MLLKSYSKVTQMLLKRYFADPTLFESYFASYIHARTLQKVTPRSFVQTEALPKLAQKLLVRRGTGGWPITRPQIYCTCEGMAQEPNNLSLVCRVYTSDAADEEDSVDLGGRRIIKKKNQQ